ncbi:MAG: aldehyde dehydrogenase family protein [Gemmatimonadetes bacterium]|nr:aldehyde dehydrogenase family protein [Gemmatimonadota bacterium]
MDADLRSIQEARDLVARATEAQQAFARADQATVDRIVRAMGDAASRAAEPLARMAVDETGMGVYEHKVLKNRFSSDILLEYILPLQTVGIVGEDRARKVKELAVPMGVVAAIIPTTNPTSTAIYKALICVKARNAIVMSPHPRATRCVLESARIMHEAAVAAGAPAGLISCMTTPTLDGTHELMAHDRTAIILATGGKDLVKAAYSAGKPAYGVGPGNVPAIIERTADVARAVAHIVDGKTFDAGVLCSSEQSAIVDAPVERAAREAFRREKAHFCSPGEKRLLERAMIPPGGKGINTAIVGQSPHAIAKLAGFAIAPDAKLLVVELTAVGREEPLSREKMSPVLGFYVEDGWEACCRRAIELLHLGGVGHSLVLHSRDEKVIHEFFSEKPAFRISVNTNSALGAVGYTTGFAPAMTLGPGAWGGSSTSDNITPLHLINIKRLGEEIRAYHDPLRDTAPARGAGSAAAAPGWTDVAQRAAANAAPLAAAEVQGIVERFLAEIRSVPR